MSGLIRLAAYLGAKYAQQEDISLGAPISAEKARILKDKLILIYDKLAQGITSLPAFQELNEKLAGHPMLEEFNRLIINMVNYVETRDLKSIFNYNTKLIDVLNALKNTIIGEKIPREELLLLDAAIKSIQDHIWKESKRILNIHDLRGILPSFPQLEGILEKPPVPTWDFGPSPKNPAKPKIRQRWDRAKDLMKRLEKEMQEEEAAKQRKPK
jgi:hypothetical protein